MRILWRAFKTLLIFVSGFVTGVFAFLRFIANSPIMLSKLKEGFVDGLEQLLFGRTRKERYVWKPRPYTSYYQNQAKKNYGHLLNPYCFQFSSKECAYAFANDLMEQFEKRHSISVGDVIFLYNDVACPENMIEFDAIDYEYVWDNPTISVNSFRHGWYIKMPSATRKKPAL